MSNQGMSIDGEPKVDGRTKAGRAAKAAAKPGGGSGGIGRDPAAVAAAVRASRPSARQTPAREPSRAPSRGRAEVRGRDGELLTRQRTATNDIFHIPAELIEPGWEMQWIPVSVLGNQEVVMDQNLQMLENGWRPVASDRFPGRFMPVGHKGHIIRGGQGLYERPKVLCDEARAEDESNARRLISDRDQSLMGGKTNLRQNIPDGFSMDRKYRGTGGDVRISIDRALDIPAANYELAEPGE